MIQKGAEIEEMQCGMGMYIDVWSAEVLAGHQGDLEMYGVVSQTVITIKHNNIVRQNLLKQKRRGETEGEQLI